MALRRSLLPGASVALLALLATACGFEKRAELRYRMVVTLAQEGRQVRAEGVQEIRAVALKKMTAEHLSGAAAVNGEAIVLDMASGPLFLSLRTPIEGPGLHNAVLAALNGSVPAEASEYVAALRRLAKRGGTAALPPEHWPLAIAVPGTAGPEGARFLTAREAGVTGITIAVTDAPVDTALKDRFPWLATFTTLPVPEPGPGLVQTEFDPRTGGRTAFLERRDFIFNPTDVVERRLYEQRKAAEDAAREAWLRRRAPPPTGG